MGKPAVGDGTIRAFCETVALLRERPGLAWSMGPLPGPDGRTFGVCDLDGCVAVNGGSGRQAHGLAFVEHLLRSEVELSRCADGSCYPVLFATEVEAGPHRLAYGELVGAGRMVAANGLWCPAALDAAVEAVFSGVSALTDSLAASRSGVVRVRLDDRDCVMAFVPIGNTDGWSMVSVIPDDVIMEQGNAIIGTSTVVLFLVVLVVGAAAFFGLAAFRFTRSMRAQGAETRAREELFSVLASATDEVFLMLSRDPVRVDYVSPNVGRILGVGPDEVRADCAVLELEDAEGPVDTASLDDGRTVVREGLRHNRATGEPLWFTDSLYDVEVDGGRRCMAVLSDRTRERRNEEVLREALSVAEVANESKSTFLSNVSHDIRTPMNAIVGLATLLLRDAGDPDLVRDHTRKIQASSLHMLGLLNDVLDMSKIESGKTTLNLSEFELSELAEDVVTIARPRALAKGQDFRVDVSGVRDGLVVGDKLRINQVLINIITNAVKYTPEGGTVEFDLVQTPSPRANFASLRFTVRDDGMGMAPELMETIFDPFTREESSVTNRVQGTGLGLAIAKSLVELMGGRHLGGERGGPGERLRGGSGAQGGPAQGQPRVLRAHGHRQGPGGRRRAGRVRRGRGRHGRRRGGGRVRPHRRRRRLHGRRGRGGGPRVRPRHRRLADAGHGRGPDGPGHPRCGPPQRAGHGAHRLRPRRRRVGLRRRRGRRLPPEALLPLEPDPAARGALRPRRGGRLVRR